MKTLIRNVMYTIVKNYMKPSETSLEGPAGSVLSEPRVLWRSSCSAPYVVVLVAPALHVFQAQKSHDIAERLKPIPSSPSVPLKLR